jgi:membrane protein YdbS with pleckstrin-like domain
MRPEPGALRIAQLSSAIVGGVLLAVVMVCAFATPALVAWRWWLVAFGAILVVSTAFDVLVLEPRAHRSIRYELRDAELELHRGVMIRSMRVVPYRQVLVIERRVGPLLHSRGLVTTRLRLPEGHVDIVGVTDTSFDAIRSRVTHARDHG